MSRRTIPVKRTLTLPESGPVAKMFDLPGVSRRTRGGKWAGRAHKRWLAWWLSLILLAVVPLIVHGNELTPATAGSGSLFLHSPDGVRAAPRQNTALEIEVSGPAARVRMTQSFLNDSSDWVEAVYVFPLPDDAAVDHMRVRTGERIIEGEIRERGAARRDYEQARAEGKRAGLVEQERPNLFTTSVANIGPGESVEIEIEYQQSVAWDDGVHALRIPLTLTPRYIPGVPGAADLNADRTGSGWARPTPQVPDAARVSPPMVTHSASQRLTLSAVIDTGVELGGIESRYHEVRIRPEGRRYFVELKAADAPLDHDLELNWRNADQAAPAAGLFVGQRDQQHYALLSLEPPAETEAEPAMPREMIFVIDTSGSMHGNSIAQAKAALKLAIGRLADTDRFNVIEFNSYTRARFPHPVEAGSGQRAAALAWVDALIATNGTEMEPAIRLALAGSAPGEYLRQIVFITDGSVGNEQQLFETIADGLGNSRLFTVGIGSAPNTWFMRKAAEAGRGTFTYISAVGEVQEKMSALFAKLEKPVLTDLSVHWPDGVAATSYPEIVPDLYHGEPVVLRTQISEALPPGSVVELRGRRRGRDWRQQVVLGEPVAYDGVSVLWARARIEALSDRERLGVDTEELRREIVETALAHHLVSKYTSLVAIDKTPVRPAEATLDSRVVPNLMAHGQSFERIFGFPATATPAPLQCALGLAAVLLALLALLISRISGLDRRGTAVTHAA